MKIYTLAPALVPQVALGLTDVVHGLGNDWLKTCRAFDGQLYLVHGLQLANLTVEKAITAKCC